MESFCRACLNKFNESTELFQYCESNRRLFIYCTGLQVKHNDTFTFQLCKECYLNLKFACKFKKQCRTSDKKIKSYLTLKRDGEISDFSTYLKNIEDTLTFRLPISSKNNTPAHQKNYDDDDNVSTCTSIQNFMSDMLQGEEMLPAEAKIIREVIQEEADILEDSLDSHWLQDDISVDNDFGMDFNFAGFSTPHSINNDHCYTPRRLENDQKDDTYYYTSKDTLRKPDHNEITHGENATECEYDVKSISIHNNKENNIVNQNDMPLLDGCDIELDGIVEDQLTMNSLKTDQYQCNKNTNNKQITVVLNKGVASEALHSPLTNELESYINILKINEMSSIKNRDGVDRLKLQNNENNIDVILKQNEIDVVLDKSLTNNDQFMNNDRFNQEKYKRSLETTVNCEIDQYINKVELKKKVNIGLNNSKLISKKCSIERNLEMALKNNDSQDFLLDQLLTSPQVSIRSGASTPTINNILFGNLTPREATSVVPDLGLNTVEEPDIIEELLKENQRQSTPRKGSDHTKLKKQIKDLNKLKESKLKPKERIGKSPKGFNRSERKKRHPRKKGYKDMTRLKYNLRDDNGSDCETLDNDLISDSDLSVAVKDETYEFEKENKNATVNNDIGIEKYTETVSKGIKKENCSDTRKREIKEENDSETIICEYKKENYSLTVKSEFGTENCNETFDSEMLDAINPSADASIYNIKLCNDDDDDNHDLDISFSKLLQFDASQNIDLNISIASDLLSEEKLQNDSSNVKNQEFVFKAPISPPDNKYDLDENLCKICNKIYRNNGALRRHFVKVHKQRLPTEKKKLPCQKIKRICAKCGKAFYDASHFNKHMKQHEDPDIFKCEFCTLNFSTRGRFNVHVRTTHAIELARKKILENNDQNTADKDTEHPKNSKARKTYVCSTCGKEFAWAGNLNIHIRRHNKNYSVKCNVCGKGFFRNYELNLHMVTHSQERKFACEFCPKTYRSRHFLVGHMYQHLGKDIFKCKFCDRQFICNQHLQQHTKTRVCQKNRGKKKLEDHDTGITVSNKKMRYEEQASIYKENVTKVDTVETSETKSLLNTIELDEIN